MPINVKSLDHLVLTVESIARTLDFYERVLGMRPVTFGEDRHALEFGDQKINLHRNDATFSPKPLTATAGSADICFLISGSARDAVLHLQDHGVAIEQGPVERFGARGKRLMSVYFRDPDGNLIEVAESLPDVSSSSAAP